MALTRGRLPFRSYNGHSHYGTGYLIYSRCHGRRAYGDGEGNGRVRVVYTRLQPAHKLGTLHTFPGLISERSCIIYYIRGTSRLKRSEGVEGLGNIMINLRLYKNHNIIIGAHVVAAKRLEVSFALTARSSFNTI